MRQIILDTETTGLEPEKGHRIIEIGCIEMVNRRLTGEYFHVYLNPERLIDPDAINVHGLTDEFVRDKPLFKEVKEKLLNFLQGAELIIHNAPFDIGFINYELKLFDATHPPITELCGVIDSLVLARQLHPGQRNNLDALCQRYHVDNSDRNLHGALLDAKLLAQVYLAMTGGQTTMFAQEQAQIIKTEHAKIEIRRLAEDRLPLKVISANAAELAEHEKYLAEIL